MSEPILSRADIASLYQIVDEANRAYLKEAHQADKSAFNILRVLAALRLLHQDSPGVLYNAVLFITKNYNPQTYYHWKKAIEDLNRNRSLLFKSKSNYCRPEITTYTKTYQNSFNRSRVNESEHLQSKSYAQINIPQQHNSSKEESFEDQDQKDVSQTNAETGKRQYYTKADSVSHVSKNHYISFQPYRHSLDRYRNHYYDKENINSTNVEESRKRESAYQYIEAIQRDLNRTAKNSQTKTPIDQSFIKNINNSESPFLFSRMPQEITVMDPIEEQMNARANTFYCFNLKLKVFSSLQANSFVFMKAKENQMKARFQHHSKLFQNSFIGLKTNTKMSKQIRKKQQMANKLNSSNLTKKVFSVLKLMFELQRQKESQKIPSLSQYNKISYEFMLNLLFALNRSTEEEKLTFIDFQSKIMELIHSDEANKLYLIVKYFGKHSWATEDNIQNLINLYKQQICREAFDSIRIQRQSNIKFSQIRQKNLKKQSFFALKIRWNRFACYKQKIKTAENKRNRTLLEKVMKSMLETVYSTKLYSKRCEYIQRKHLFHLKNKIYKLWTDRAQNQLQSKIKLTSKVKRAIEKIQTFIKKIAFKNFNAEIQQIDEKVKMVINRCTELKKLEWFKCLRINILNANKQKQCERAMQKYRCAVAVTKWKESTKKGKSISQIMRIIKSYYFRTLVLPTLEDSIQIMRDIQLSELDLQRRTFKALRRYANQEQNTREELLQAVTNKLAFMRRRLAVSMVKQDYEIERARKERQTLRLKYEEALSCRKFRHQQAFIAKLLHLHASKSEETHLTERLTYRLNLFTSKRFLFKLAEIRQVRKNENILKRKLGKQEAQKLANHFIHVICQSKAEKISKLRRRNASRNLGRILYAAHSEQLRKRQLSRQFRNNWLFSLILKGLSLLVSQSEQVRQIAQRMKNKKNWDIIKESISHWRRANQASQIHLRHQIKTTYLSLKSQKMLKINNNRLSQWRVANSHQSLIQKLRLSKQLKVEKSCISQKSVRLLKWLGVSRAERFYIDKLISNKHLYMALKFRALKLCLNSFRVLSRQVPRKRHLGGHKGQMERLSTDIAE